MKFVCSKCGHKADVDTRLTKCECGGLWKLEWKVPKFDLSLIDKDTWSIFRYRTFMPLQNDTWKETSLGEGMSPIVQFSEDVMLKMDYFMPTLSFKDRGAAVLMSHCKAMGVKRVVQDSSGNAGNSVAAYSAKLGIDCEIFVPEGTSDKKINMIKSHGARVNVVEGTRDHCAHVCREKVDEEKVFYASHVFNPFFYEGTKTYMYEVYEQLKRVPSNIFIPLGNGTLFIGIMKALEEFLASGIIETMPVVVAVQSEHCAPFIKAIESGSQSPIEMFPMPTLAEGIAIGMPLRGPEIMDYIKKYKVQVIIAPEDMILQARERLAKGGVYCEHTSAATYAAYMHHCKTNGPLHDTLIPMCGAGLKSDH
ncbi:threonine synthase [Fusibacter sp. JL216-2]|uniref:threonine synthase n=1 Tax=Fusibacter sp. JL216-2 TaxID=3071453 RepID=UPI003D3250C3